MKKIVSTAFFLLLCNKTATIDESKYECDGRIYCSEMTSCEEARWYLEHCPGVKMDGDSDGVPCESQWCH